MQLLLVPCIANPTAAGLREIRERCRSARQFVRGRSDRQSAKYREGSRAFGRLYRRGVSTDFQEGLMRRFLVTAGTVLALGGVSATGALADSTGVPRQPSQSCQSTSPPAFPGNTGSAPGSAFNGTAGSVYANPTSQGG